MRLSARFLPDARATGQTGACVDEKKFPTGARTRERSRNRIEILEGKKLPDDQREPNSPKVFEGGGSGEATLLQRGPSPDNSFS
jgi:hypothetical protein